MTPLRTITSPAAPLIRDNIDTDIIIPSREIRSASKTGLAEGLFAGWRYLDEQRRPDPEFVLNQPRFRDAEILLAGANFGCGSSREQAAWSLAEFGIRVVIAPSFNSIFRRNCVRNGILPAEADPVPIAEAAGLDAITVDLTSRSIAAPGGPVWPFTIDDESAAMLLGGLDEIALTLRRTTEIETWRRSDRNRRAWAYLEGTGA